VTARNIGLLICVAVGSLAFTARAVAAEGSIAVTNFKDGETIRYSTPLLMGSIADDKADKITVINESSKRPSREMTGLAYKGRFKALADLVPGENKLLLSAGGTSLPFKLVFKPQTNPYLIRAVYFTNSAGDTGYLSPVPNDKQDSLDKVSTAMLLMQSFSAECMNQQGFGRKTFNVDLEPDGRVKVFVVKGPQAPGAPNSRPSADVIHKAIDEQARRPLTHDLVILGRGCGYTAVGGGGLALFGGTCIYSWPSNIQEAQAAFMDDRPIDPNQFHIDAVGRNVFWANSSTCIGACLHEIDHTFGVPHSRDPFCIMTRGIDHFNRFFTLVEPPSARNPKPTNFSDKEIARYTTVSAANLACSRFFALDERKYSDKGSTQIAYNAEKQEITVTSDLGIAFVGLEVPYARPGAEYCIPIDPNKPAPKEMTIPAKEWERFKGKPFQVRVIDVDDHGTVDRDPLKAQAAPKS